MADTAKFNKIKEEIRNQLMKTVDRYGTLHPKIGGPEVKEPITPDTLQEVDEIAESMAKSSVEQNKLEAKHPRFGTSSTEETIRINKAPESNLASQLEDIGPQGSLLKQKLEEAGIDLNKIKDVSELKSPRLRPSEPYIIPPDERARIIDVGALKEAEANKLALQRLGKLAKGGALGLGALATASDVSDKNEVGAALDVAETGLGLAGGVAGRAAPFLELLRPTSTQTEEQEEAELAKYRRLNNMLTEQKKKNRMPASEE